MHFSETTATGISEAVARGAEMAANKKQRKRYRPKRVDASAAFKVIKMIEPFNASELLRLELPIRMSYEALRNGKGTEDDWSDIAAAINVTVVRARAVDALCEQTASDASDALLRVYHRAQRTGRWVFDGPGLAQVAQGIDLHEQLCELSSPLQMMDAMRTVLAVREGQGHE